MKKSISIIVSSVVALFFLGHSEGAALALVDRVASNGKISVTFDYNGLGHGYITGKTAEAFYRHLRDISKYPERETGRKSKEITGPSFKCEKVYPDTDKEVVSCTYYLAQDGSISATSSSR